MWLLFVTQTLPLVCLKADCSEIIVQNILNLDCMNNSNYERQHKRLVGKRE